MKKTSMSTNVDIIAQHMQHILRTSQPMCSNANGFDLFGQLPRRDGQFKYIAILLTAGEGDAQINARSNRLFLRLCD